MATIYRGSRVRDQSRTVVSVTDNSELFRDATHPLPLYTSVRNHSPDGFEWGYGGSGPAQLALALCCHVLGGVHGDTTRALAVYQDVKWRLVSKWQADRWEVSREYLLELIEQIEASQPA